MGPITSGGGGMGQLVVVSVLGLYMPLFLGIYASVCSLGACRTQKPYILACRTIQSCTTSLNNWLIYQGFLLVVVLLLVIDRWLLGLVYLILGSQT